MSTKKKQKDNDWRSDLLLDEDAETEFFDELDEEFGSMKIELKEDVDGEALLALMDKNYKEPKAR